MVSLKHLLPFVDGCPIYQCLIDQLRSSPTDVQGLAISLYDSNDKEAIKNCAEAQVEIIYYAEGTINTRIGPAAGLFAAYQNDLTAHWLVLRATTL